MSTLNLKRMSIRNFKGIKTLDIDFGGRLTAIKGRNASGKSSICDAWNWLLFDKDANGNAPGSDNFREKPLDADGREIHNLDTEVTLTMQLDGQPFNLRRVQREKWSKKRGCAEAVYGGNASTYTINDVEIKKTDFARRIAEIAPESIARMVGTLGAFNALDWKERRNALINLSGIDVDSELLGRDEYREIACEIAERGVSADQLRKIIADQRKQTATALNLIPVRIDEVRLGIADVTRQDRDDALRRIDEAARRITGINVDIANVRAEDPETARREELNRLQREYVRLTGDIDRKHREGRDAIDAEIRQLGRQALTIAGDITRTRGAIENDTALKANAESGIAQLRGEWQTASRDKPSRDGLTCRACGQPLPEDQADAVFAELTEKHRQRLADIKQRGEQLKPFIASADGRIEQNRQRLAELEAGAAAVKADRESAEKRLAAYPASPDYGVEPRIAEITARIEALMIDTDGTGIAAKIMELQAERTRIEESISNDRQTVARYESAEAARARVKTLEAEQKEKGATLARLERLTDQLDRFTVDRCSLLEESINGHFETVRWKLFDTQINGGIADCCVCQIPCESGLVSYESANTAAKINADIEIVNTFSKAYDVRMPLFVDNAERVNLLRHTGAQLITLTVSTDYELNIMKED